MKRIIALILVAALMLGALITLTACKKDDGTPAGMQLARGGEEYGYNFYVPEEWTVSNRGEIACAYVSTLDSTSVTFVKAEAPTGDAGKTRSELTNEYFDAEMLKLPFTVTVGARGNAITFGNATEAYEYTYTYEYEKTTIGVMQILVYNGSDFYIFTYSSFVEEKEYGITYYDYYLVSKDDEPSKLQSIINSFKFTEKKGEPPVSEYERDENGWLIVSDKTVAGFILSIPDTYGVDYSSGIVSVTKADGTNISVSKATYTGVDKDAYWEHRKAELAPLVDKTTDAEGDEVSTLSEVEDGISVAVELEGVKWAFSYEYTYQLEGKQYHVYQVLIVRGQNGYVFTYTAYEDLYATHIDEAKQILVRIKY